MRKKKQEIDHVHFLSPYGYDLQIGAEYNRMIEMMPAGSWICICDQDTLKPPGFAERVKFILEYEAEKDMLIGCKVNRVGKSSPAIIEELYEESNITAHLAKAMELWIEHKTELLPIPIVAGYCMIFNKELWEKVGGFPKASYQFDMWLSQRARCFSAQGLYIFHLYRWHNRKSPERSYSHLLRAGLLCSDPFN